VKRRKREDGKQRRKQEEQDEDNRRDCCQRQKHGDPDARYGRVSAAIDGRWEIGSGKAR